MSATIYPITISDQDELDLLYEGLHLIYSDCLRSAESLTREIIKIEKELAEFLAAFVVTDSDTEPSESRQKEINLYRTQIKRKQLVKREIEKKIIRLHRMLVRMSDPRPTEEQIEEFKERRRKSSIAEIIRTIEKEQIEQNRNISGGLRSEAGVLP